MTHPPERSSPPAPPGAPAIAGRTPPVGGSIAQLATLVGDVVNRLERPSPDAHQMVAECNAVLEGCLEAQRDGRDREDREGDPRDELRRLARLLVAADRADVVFVMRQIRRVLGRFDVHGA